MKRLLLIVSPYFIFCLLFSFLFIFKPVKPKDKNLNTKDSVIINQPVDSLNLESEVDTIF